MAERASFDLELHDPVKRQRQAQRRLNGAWADVDLPLAESIRLLASEVEEIEGRLRVISSSIERLVAEIPKSGTATVQQNAFARVQETQDGLEAVASDVTELDSELEGERNARATAVRGLETRVTRNDRELLAQSSEVTRLRSDLDDEETARAAADRTLTTSVSRVDGRVTAQSSEVTRLRSDLDDEETARAAADRTLTTSVSRVDGRVTAQSSEVTRLRSDLDDEETARAAADRTLTTSVSRVDGRVDAVSEDVTQVESEIEGEAGIRAAAVQRLTTEVSRVDGRVSGISEWEVKTQVGDLISGVGLYNDGRLTRFIVAADRFAVVPPGYTGGPIDSRKVPFSIINGQVTIPDAAIINLSGTKISARTITAREKIKSRTIEADLLESGIIEARHVGARVITGTMIQNEAGLIRSQRVTETTRYANGATAADWDYEVSRLNSVRLNQNALAAEIVFGVDKLRVKNSDPGLTPGGVQTGHIALSATAAVHAFQHSGENDVTGNKTLISRNISGGEGYRYLCYASVIGNNNGNPGTLNLYLNGSFEDGTGFSGSAHQDLILQGSSSGNLDTDKVFSVEIRRSTGRGSYDIGNATLLVFVAKR